MFFSHFNVLMITVILVALSVIVRPTTREFFEDKPMSEAGAAETGKASEKNEPSAMDKLQEIRNILQCDGKLELKDPEIMLNTIATLLQCKPAVAPAVIPETSK